jgi:hypothetical protein
MSVVIFASVFGKLGRRQFRGSVSLTCAGAESAAGENDQEY